LCETQQVPALKKKQESVQKEHLRNRRERDSVTTEKKEKKTTGEVFDESGRKEGHPLLMKYTRAQGERRALPTVEVIGIGAKMDLPSGQEG